MNGWEMLEVREMVLRDLAGFIPPNLYGTLQVSDSAIDVQLGKKLKLSSELEHVRMTVRQRRAANLLWRIGMYTVTAEELQYVEEEARREWIEKSLVVLRDNLSPVLKSYAECITEEERKLLPVFAVDNSEQDNLTDSSRKSLLKMVLGMALKRYGYDPKEKKSHAPGIIRRDLETMGIEITDETILRYLKEAAAKIPHSKTHKP